jgi:hypothetical protein
MLAGIKLKKIETTKLLFRYNFELVQQKEKAEKNISRNNNTVESD